MAKLISWYSSHSTLHALGIAYPKFWAMLDAETQFTKHLQVLTKWYRELKFNIVDRCVSLNLIIGDLILNKAT
jgi:hypothetical protein